MVINRAHNLICCSKYNSECRERIEQIQYNYEIAESTNKAYTFGSHPIVLKTIKIENPLLTTFVRKYKTNIHSINRITISK